MNQKDLLRHIAIQLPHRDIVIDGELYLERYYLSGEMSERLASLWPEGSRPTPQPGHHPGKGTSYLHRFVKPDPDRHLHNHPWPARSVILSGGYRELRLVAGEVKSYSRYEGDQVALLADTYHTIAELYDREVWTLFTHWDKVQGWGFWVDGVHVPHREYDR